MAHWGPDIDVQSLAKARNEGVELTLLDVRESEELALCAIDGALHIPMQEIPPRITDLPRGQPLVVMCHHGGRSHQVAQFLRGQGFTNVHNLAGGIDSWALAIDLEMNRY